MASSMFACVECGSTRFEELDGIWYCHKGHQQEGGQQVAQDGDDYARYGKVSRESGPKEKQKRSRVYRGSKGFELYLKAWQYILWKQCYGLIHRHGLPGALWGLVRELWALRLGQLTQRLDDADKDLDQDLDVSTTSESGSERENSNNLTTFKTSKHISDNPSLYDTIALNYIGILVLRHPTRLAKIYSYIREEEICFIRAIRYVPTDIRDHLAPEYQAALDTTVIPTQHHLQLAVYRVTAMYGSAFSMVLPLLNWPAILLENTQSLALPLEVYPFVKRLASILAYEFKYPQRHEARRHANTYPEVQLMSLVVVATKMLYPFDSGVVKRHPNSANEPTALQVDWRVWLQAKRNQEAKEKQKKLTPSKAIEVTDADILKMPVDQLDDYMDWFQRTYVKDVRVDHQHREIINMFPLSNITSYSSGEAAGETAGGRSKNDVLERLEIVQAGYQPREAVAEDEIGIGAATIIRPGQQYQQYRSTGEMSEVAKVFHDEAAELACTSVEALLRACLKTERLLLMHQHEKRRAELFESPD